MASSNGPRKSILPAWAFPLPVTLSPLLGHYSAPSREHPRMVDGVRFNVYF